MGVVTNHASVKIKSVKGDLIDRYLSLVEVYYKINFEVYKW